jgi:hypothetical protein
MSLDVWQRDLVSLMTGGQGVDAAAADRVGLRPDEVAWLGRVVDEPGFALTMRVQREWRAFRISTSLPLTTRLLGDGFDAAVRGYVDASPCPSSFYLREAEQFADHIERQRPPPPHLGSVLRFELAMLHLSQWQADGGAAADPASRPPASLVPVVHPAADIVTFSAPPERVLGALVDGLVPPRPTTAAHFLLCAPDACRRATPDEHRTLALLKMMGYRRDLDLDPATLATLRRAGALIGPVQRDVGAADRRRRSRNRRSSSGTASRQSATMP